MTKKNLSSTELTNIFPEWSEVRKNDQSIGFQLFNALASPIDRMDRQLDTQKRNTFITTANLDEIDIISKVQLPITFEFDQDETDPLATVPLSPTVSGLHIISPTQSGWFDVIPAINNDIQSFWYDSIPNRLSLMITVTGVNDLLIDQNFTLFPFTGELTHHLGGGRLTVETLSGIQYVTTNQFNQIDRGQVIINGITRKGTEETETLVFPWNMKQSSLKEWKTISKVEAYHMEDTVEIKLDSADFSHGPYLSFYNLRFGTSRPKVDEFWNLGTTLSGSSLDRIGYISDEWQQLLLGFSDKEVKRSWELLDESYNSINFIDMAIQPFSNRAWTTTNSGILCCYDLTENLISGVQFLATRTPGAEIDIEIENKYIILGEDIGLIPWHARPIRQVLKWRLWYQDPQGNKYGLLDGTPVSFSSDFWVLGDSLLRYLGDTVIITPTTRGEYIFVLEAMYVDGVTESQVVMISVDYKLPIFQFDASLLVSGIITGIDFDSDQQLWLKGPISGNNYYYKFQPNTDNMLIDFDNKILYFHEKYDQVVIV